MARPTMQEAEQLRVKMEAEFGVPVAVESRTNSDQPYVYNLSSHDWAKIVVTIIAAVRTAQKQIDEFAESPGGRRYLRSGMGDTPDVDGVRADLARLEKTARATVFAIAEKGCSPCSCKKCFDARKAQEAKRAQRAAQKGGGA